MVGRRLKTGEGRGEGGESDSRSAASIGQGTKCAWHLRSSVQSTQQRSSERRTGRPSCCRGGSFGVEGQGVDPSM